MEAVLFDGAVHSNDVCRGDKLIAWTMETLVIIFGRAELHPSVEFPIVALLNYVIVNKIMMLLLWRRPYSMASSL